MGYIQFFWLSTKSKWRILEWPRFFLPKNTLVSNQNQIYNSAKSIANYHPGIFKEAKELRKENALFDEESKDPVGVIYDDFRSINRRACSSGKWDVPKILNERYSMSYSSSSSLKGDLRGTIENVAEFKKDKLRDHIVRSFWSDPLMCLLFDNFWIILLSAF